jgi:aspartate ammonia-lyase
MVKVSFENQGHQFAKVTKDTSGHLQRKDLVIGENFHRFAHKFEKSIILLFTRIDQYKDD